MSGTVTSIVHAPVSWHPHWGSERVSNLPGVSLAGSGRARIPHEVGLAASPFLSTPRPLRATSTVDRPGRTAVCRQLAKAVLQKIQETIQSAKGEGKAALKKKLFSSAAGRGGAGCHRLLRARKGQNAH